MVSAPVSFNSAMLEQMQAEGLDLDGCIRVLTVTGDAAVLIVLRDKGLTLDDAIQIAKANRPTQRPSIYSADAGPKARWGYDGLITPRLPDKDWWPLRNFILDRDGHVCRYCGGASSKMCADHVVPLSRGGSNDESNLVACCVPCNSSKADKLLDEWDGRFFA